MSDAPILLQVLFYVGLLLIAFGAWMQLKAGLIAMKTTRQMQAHEKWLDEYRLRIMTIEQLIVEIVETIEEPTQVQKNLIEAADFSVNQWSKTLHEKAGGIYE